MCFKKKYYFLLFFLIISISPVYSIFPSSLDLKITGNTIVNSPITFTSNYSDISPDIFKFQNLSVIESEPNSLKIIDYNNDGKKDEIVILDGRHYSMEQGFHIFDNRKNKIRTFETGNANLGTSSKGKIDVINTDRNKNTKEFIFSREDGFMVVNSSDEEVFHSRNLDISSNSVDSNFVVADINKDGYRNELLIIFSNSSQGKKLHYFKSKNNTLLLEKIIPLNNLNNQFLYEDINYDTTPEIIISNTSNSVFVINPSENFNVIHEIKNIPRPIESIDTGDSNGDNYQEIFISTSSGYFYSFNVMNQIIIDSQDSFFSQRLGPRSNFFKILDIDNNGLEDDIFYINQGNYRSSPYYYKSKKINGEEYFSKELPQYGAYGSTAFIEVYDINDDLENEIIFTDDTHKKIIVLNKFGDTIFEKQYNSTLTNIAFGDLNNDSLTDYAVTNNQETGFEINTVVNCDISFNGGLLQKIPWNANTKNWSYTKTFNESKNFQYNITCSKNGYQPQTLQGNISIRTDTSSPKITFLKNYNDYEIWNSSDSLILKYQVIDKDFINSCSIYKNSIELRNKKYNNLSNITSLFEVYLDRGQNELKITCNDFNGNTNTSQTISIFSKFNGTNQPSISKVSGKVKDKENITIEGIGFRDKPPKLWIYDEFEGVNGTTVSKNATYGTWNTMTHKYNSKYAVSGNTSTQYFSYRSGGEKANIKLPLNESFTEVFISYWVIIPPGKRFPGNAESTKTFSTVSAWKLLWLNDGAIHGSGHDDMIFPTWFLSEIPAKSGRIISKHYLKAL